MKRVGEILAAFFDNETMKKAEKIGDLFSISVWQEMLENCKLSQGVTNSRIVELERSILIVEADHPGWILLLQTKQRELLETARRRFPEIALTGISFKLSRSSSKVSADKLQQRSGPQSV